MADQRATIVSALIAAMTIQGIAICAEPASNTAHSLKSHQLPHGKTPPSTIRRVTKALNERVVKDVKLIDVPLEDALDYFSRVSTRQPGEPGVKRRTGFSMILREGPGGTADQSSSPRINLTKPRISLADLLNEICKQANLMWKIEPYALLMVPTEPPSTKNKDE